jgi:hypothetical protein
MNVTFKIEDYLSIEEIKEECKLTLQKVILQHFSKESQIERLISNLSYEFLFDEISKCIGEDSEKLVKETVIKILKQPETFSYLLFRRKNTWEQEESKGYKILQETMESCKELIKNRIVEEIEKYDFNTEEFRYKIQDTIHEIIEEKLFNVQQNNK